MFRFIAKIFAELQYRWREEIQAENHALNAALALNTSKEHRERAAKLTAEADEMEKRIKEVSEMEEQGYWLCASGHEETAPSQNLMPGERRVCRECFKPLKLIKRSEMSGQEKYESDKERDAAQKMADRRAEAKQVLESAENAEKTAAHFQKLATINRNVAEKVRAL